MKIFCDADETLFNSIDSVLIQLNRRFSTNYTMSEVTEWDFKNIFPQITSIEIEEIFDSVEFFDNLTWKDGALDFIHKYYDDITIVTCGNATNLYLKELFIRHWFPSIKFIGIESTVMDKSSVDMSGGIMIDDNQKNLWSCNADYKILFENVPRADWNDEWNGFYGKNWDEIDELVGYIIEEEEENE